MATYQKPKGTLDFYGLEAMKIHYVQNEIRNVIENFGYNEIITPIFENTEVFLRLGDESDVVNKEMYTFNDKGNRSITLRPEGTAAVCRSYLENKIYANPGITKFFYNGPMFRYERPGTGRYRQFTQFGVEVFGLSEPLLDCDVIYTAYSIFKRLGISNIKLVINSIGDFKSRSNYAKALQEYFSDKIDTMCPDCKRRLETNPMRILDCKVDKEHPALVNAPKIKDYLSDESKEYFSKVLNGLDALGVPYACDDNLVRGLDYYTDTVFEFIIDSNDALNGLAICAGGKYSELVKSMSGPDVPGIGYAFGIERIIGVMDSLGLFASLGKEFDATILALDYESKVQSLVIANQLRLAGLKVDLDYKNMSMKQQFKLCDRNNSRFILILGEDERLNNMITVKDKINNTQEKIKLEELENYIKGNK